MLLIYKESRKMLPYLAEQSGAARIAILAEVFPLYSESAAYREFLELQRAGIPVVPFAIRYAQPGPLPNDAMPVLEWTERVRSQIFLTKLRAHIGELLQHPARYLATFGMGLVRSFLWPPRILRALHHFHEGVVLAFLLQRRNIGHIHVYHMGEAASAALVASRISHIPYSLSLYGSDFSVRGWEARATLRRASRIIANSEMLRDRLLAKYGSLSEDLIKVIRIGVDVDVFVPQRKQRNLLQKPRILTVARLTHGSGIDVLLKACDVLEAREVDFEAIIVGEGPFKTEFQKLANAMRLNHRVRFTGARRMEEIIELMSRADLFVLPCRQEVKGDFEAITTPMLEAMSAGLPIIATRVDGIQELVDRSNGRILPEENYEALAEAIIHLLEDNRLRQELGQAARKKIQRQFNLKKNARKLAALLAGATAHG